MKLEASPGRVVMKLWNAPSKSKLVMPENVSIEAFPTYEIVHVGAGKESQFTHGVERIPFAIGDRVIAMSAKCIIVESEGEKLFIADWTAIFAKVTE